MSRIGLDQLVTSAALSMAEDIFVSWGVEKTFNEAVDDTSKYSAAVMISPSLDEGRKAGGFNTIVERQLSKIGIFKHSDVANETDTVRRANIAACKDIGLEIFARIVSLAQDLKYISVESYEFVPPIGQESANDYFNILDAQLDGVGMLIGIERTFVSDPCMEGAGRVLVELVE